VTVVRRPLQSMVCSGRLTICDLRFIPGRVISYTPPPPIDSHVLKLDQHSPQGDAIDGIDVVYSHI
jgi:hypothetical protein